MKRTIITLFLLTSLVSGISAQTIAATQNNDIPSGFKSDGCSMFPDGEYRDCCEKHDLDYFKGGTWKERWRSDNNLRKCVAAKKGFKYKPLSIMMWTGVRAFGVSWLPTPFRWGFGKSLKAGMVNEEKKQE